MDDQVQRAMKRWPNVPAVYGWLRLTRRGRWHLVDRGAEGFDEALHGKGSPITSEPITDFIARNYEHDERGAWFWQNGPQRCFVQLELAPWILRVYERRDGSARGMVTQTGERVDSVDRVLMDGDGNVYFRSNLGPAAMDDRDIALLDIDEGEDGGLRLKVPIEGAQAVRVETEFATRGAIERELGFCADPEGSVG